MVKRTRKYKKSKIVKRKYTRKNGGNKHKKHFNERDTNELLRFGFTQEHINYLNRRKENGANIPISLIRHFINNHYTPQRIIDDMQEGEETDVESDIE